MDMNNNIGLIGAIVGTVIGLAGGSIGVYFSIRNTNGPRERRFMIQAGIACFIFVCSFLAIGFLLPQSRVWIWGPYAALLLLGITYTNRRQSAIRQEEQAKT
jgi:hypothetical protein